MPLYEFRCNDCGAVNEYLVGLTDPRPDSCKKCGADALQKIMSKTSFVLKGTGWYETDFKSGSTKKPAATSENSCDSKSESDTSKSPAKSDSPAIKESAPAPSKTADTQS